MMNDFDEWEKEEAERRKQQYEKDKKLTEEKSKKENKKHELGIGVEDGTKEFEDNEDE